MAKGKVNINPNMEKMGLVIKKKMKVRLVINCLEKRDT